MARAVPTTPNLNLPKGTLGSFEHQQSFKAAMDILDGAVGSVLTGSKTWDAASVANGAQTTTTVTVTGAALGDFVTGVSLSITAAGLSLNGYVSAADTVTVVAQNNSGGAIDLGSATLAVLVRQA